MDRVNGGDMTAFDNLLAQSTAPGSNNIPGCVLTAVNQDGTKFYSKLSGYDSVAPDASELQQDTVFWIASCTKLIGTIAALQCVERGQISLDEPVERILPELANLDIIKPSKDADALTNQQFTLEPSTKKITLRHLLSHTSGLAYDNHQPLLGQWRTSRQEPLMGLSGKLLEAFVVPLLFEPGEGWTYSGGIDLACEIVARLNKVSLEDYLHEHVFGPLGMTETTFRLERHSELAKRLAKMTKRTDYGVLEESLKPWPDVAPADCGGAGLYSTAEDYAKVLSELLRDKPLILKPETVELMFSPQLKKGSTAIHDLHNSAIVKAMTGITNPDEAINFGLGGLYIENEVGSYKKHSLTWGGLPNLYWFASREHGTAGFYASQLLPPGDQKSVRVAQEFFEDVFRNNDSA